LLWKWYICTYNLDQFLDDVLLVFNQKVFFSDLTITHIETTAAYTSLALLCDIGGALGLILGSTLLTFCEIADATLMSLLTYAFRRRQKADMVSPV
jgi:Amiloride-sensitive sodium channel